MRQRVAFLRTLLAGRPLLCLDEPFGALDALTRAQLQRWLAGALVREPRTVLLVTHDVEEAVLLADRIVLLSPRPGRVVAHARASALPRPRAAHRPEGRRAARARPDRAGGRVMARGKALLPAAIVVLLARRLGDRRPGRRASTRCILPAPTQIATSLWDDRGLLGADLAVTGKEVLLGPRRRGRRSAPLLAVGDAPLAAPCATRCARW